MKPTNISQYIKENIDEFKNHILQRKTEPELSKIYGCSSQIICRLKKELKLQSRDLFEDNKRNNHNHNITHCKLCNSKGKRNTCKVCRSKKSHIAKKEILINAAGGKCSKCGYCECIAALDFHHLDPNEKEINLAKNVNIHIKLKEIEKCILLCCRCHRELHWKENIDFVQKNRYAIDKAKEKLLTSN